tara:strand:- start:20 stop:226 length:207 start_codon:yes stop_codon:yes gene_type:complete
MFGKSCDMGCKECFELVLKFVFVAVFTYGVMSAVCCMKSCNNNSQGCCKTQAVAKQCGASCVKPCCAK